MPYIETSILILLAIAVFGYLLGSVPFGMVVARMMGLGNLRDIGSGNIGATNVLRTGNKFAAFLTLIFDAGKGAAPVLIGRWIGGEDAAQLGGFAAFLGHLFPIWLGFKGGKGVATFIGLMLALNWKLGLGVCGVWLFMALTMRYSSLAALLSAGLAPSMPLYFREGGDAFVLMTLLAILIYRSHWENIKRLRAGTEPRIGQK